MELHHEAFLRRAGSLLGTIVKIDKLTSIYTRGKFARIYVEIDLQKPLVPKIEVEEQEVSGDGEVVKVRIDSGALIDLMMVLEDGSITLVWAHVSSLVTIINDRAIKEGNAVIIQEEILNPPDFGPWMIEKKGKKK
ncbi:hypothetical protein CR513_27862, partial [Mucuna pruriens]